MWSDRLAKRVEEWVLYDDNSAAKGILPDNQIKVSKK